MVVVRKDEWSKAWSRREARTTRHLPRSLRVATWQSAPSISVVETICGLTRLSSHASNDGKNDFSNGVSFHKPESLGLTRYFHP